MGRFSPSFLIRNKQGTYYFRYIPPKIFTGYDDKRFEIRRSLQTSLKSHAVQRARRILVGVEALMLEFTMKGETTEHPIEWLRKTIDELIRKDEFERKQRQDFFSRILEEASKRLEAPLEVMEFKKAAATPRKSAQPRLVGLPAKRISEVINAYVIENRVHWREKTREENQFLLNLIVSVLGDRKVGSLTLEDMRIYKEAVLSIPKHRSKLPKYRNLSVKELLQMEIPEEERLSARNALKYLSRARTFFTWGRLNGYVKEDIGIVLTYKLPEREKKKRVPFSHTDLRKLIQSEEYKHGLHKEAHHFWLPLLGMFTGARLNELCQLHVNDIRRIRNIWVISIREGGDRKLKNKQSERDVPLHSKLLVSHLASRHRIKGKIRW